jgi:GNAT superfamily N-acetyltransferase
MGIEGKLQKVRVQKGLVPRAFPILTSVRRMAGGSKTKLVGDGFWHTLEGFGGCSVVTIRAIAAGDAVAACELTRQLGYERTPAQISGWIAGLAGREREQQAFVACRGDEVIGWIEVAMQRHLQSDEFALIGGLVVKDGARSSGVGGQLCRHAERWAAECGVKAMRVTSRSTREAAHRFYERDGYERVKMSVVFEKALEGAGPETAH